MSHHAERMNKIVMHELSWILLLDSKNPLLKFVSITKVALTNDLSIATIWYTVIGKETEIEATSKALEESRGFLRTELAKRIQVRKTPDLKFKYDESLEYGKHIEELLSK